MTYIPFNVASQLTITNTMDDSELNFENSDDQIVIYGELTIGKNDKEIVEALIRNLESIKASLSN